MQSQGNRPNIPQSDYLDTMLTSSLVVGSAVLKAVEAAISARQWSKAVLILEDVQESTRDPASTAKYFRRIAGHYASVGEFEVSSSGGGGGGGFFCVCE